MKYIKTKILCETRGGEIKINRVTDEQGRLYFYELLSIRDVNFRGGESENDKAEPSYLSFARPVAPYCR